MPPDPRPAYRPLVAALLVFVASGAVLVLEILGIRLLAPYVGLTLETTTTIIGTVLAGIAAGAALGGRIADLVESRWLVPELLAGGGLLAIATVPLVRVFGAGLQGQGGIGAFMVTLIAMFPAATVLSAVTPAVAKVQLRDLRRTGSVVGRLSGWATAGALVGTFLTGFVIVPLLPVDVAVFLVGGGLLVLGVVLGLASGDRTRRAAAGLLVLGLLAIAPTLAAGHPCDVESTYHCAQIVEDPDRPTGRTLLLDDLRHSYVDLEDPTYLKFEYTRWIGDAIDGMRPAREPLEAVFLGGGGFTLPRYLAATRPGSRSRTLEVDGALVELDRERLGLRTRPGLEVVVGDARLTLRDEGTDSADLVVGDAFGGRSVPWHLATEEFLSDVRRVLRPDGLYVANIIDYGERRLARAEAATLREVFAHVALVARQTRDGEPAGGNLVLVASDAPIPRGVASTAHRARTFTEQEVERFSAGATVLRDDDAPADQLLTPLP